MTLAVAQLRQRRIARGWTLDDVVDELHRLARELGEPVPGVDRQAVSKWERGVHRPRPYYVRLFSIMYQASPMELGLVDELAEAPESLIVGADAAVSEDVKRRTFLKGGLMALSGIGAAAAVEAIGAPLVAAAREAGAQRSTNLRDDPVGEFERLTAGWGTLYWTIPPPQLLPLVEQHAQSGQAFVRRQADAGLRCRASSALAETELLVGRLLFFDLQTPEQARSRFWNALEAAEEADDTQLAGVILAHASFVPGFAGRLPDAGGLLGMADRRLRQFGASPLQGWLASVHAEVAAISGDVETSRAAVAQSEELLERGMGTPVPRWFDWFNEPRLDSFAGYCLLRAAQTRPVGTTDRSRWANEARTYLQRALRGLDGTFAAKQQGVVLADLAHAHAELGDMPEACSALGAAGAAVRATGYAMARQRVQVVREALRQRWSREPMVRGLDELLPL